MPQRTHNKEVFGLSVFRYLILYMKGQYPISLGKYMILGHVVDCYSNDFQWVTPSRIQALTLSPSTGTLNLVTGLLWPVGCHKWDPSRALSSTSILRLSSWNVALSCWHNQAYGERLHRERGWTTFAGSVEPSGELSWKLGVGTWAVTREHQKNHPVNFGVVKNNVMVLLKVVNVGMFMAQQW